MTQDSLHRRYVQVVVSITEESGDQILAIDPWGNCPSATAREEGRSCADCEFWGNEVEGIDWYEFSLCLFDGRQCSGN